MQVRDPFGGNLRIICENMHNRICKCKGSGHKNKADKQSIFHFNSKYFLNGRKITFSPILGDKHGTAGSNTKEK